jgi:hypothetical protein
MLNGARRSPIENAFLSHHFGNKHHAGEKEINVKTFEQAGQGVCPWQKAKGN